MKKILQIGAFLFLIVLIYTIVDSYGIFESNIQSQVEGKIADWQIEVNGSQIIGETNTFNIPNVFWTTNTAVVPGKASPGLSAYFEIIINPTGSEVAIEYEIELDFLALNNEQIFLTNIKNVDTNLNLEEIDTNKYRGVIPLTKVLAGQNEVIRVDFVWNNDDDNSSDSVYANQLNPVLEIPITIRLLQYLGG